MILWLVGCTMTGGEGGDGRRLGAALLNPTTPTGGTPSTPAPEPDPTTTSTPVTGPWEIETLTVDQDGPFMVFDLALTQPVDVVDTVLRADFYYSGRQIADWVTIEDGVLSYAHGIVDACTYFLPDFDYVTLSLDNEQEALALVEIDATLVWDRFNEETIVGEGADDFVVLCDLSGSWPTAWDVTVKFPGGNFALAGRGTLRHPDGGTIVLDEDFEEAWLKTGTWTWDADWTYGNPRQIQYLP